MQSKWIRYPSLQAFIALSDYSYSLEELTEMERKIIFILNFDILAPTAEEFYGINADYFEFTEEQRFFGEYFLDIALIDYNLLKYKQSTIAVACGYIVMKFFKLKDVHLIIDNTSKEVKQKDVKNVLKIYAFWWKIFRILLSWQLRTNICQKNIWKLPNIAKASEELYRFSKLNLFKREEKNPKLSLIYLILSSYLVIDY